jgi:hypothetical protein
MENSVRLFNCLRCHCQVFICSHCDHGNIYCGPTCSRAARTELLKEARQRYQKSRRGRLKHAEHQHHYRQRKKEKVMDQGSLFQLQYVPLKKKTNKGAISQYEPFTCMDCHFCGEYRSSFIRIGFLRREDKRKIQKHSASSLGP